MKIRSNFIAAWLLLATAGSAVAATHYVAPNSPNPTPPYTNWGTAATVIQDAVDAAATGDEVVVTNGSYASGGWLGWPDVSNRVAALKALTIHSVNGAGVTLIDGAGSMRCVYLATGANLAGFTLTNGFVGKLAGGGVFCEDATAVVSNCVIVSNSVYGFSYDLSLDSGEGGGAYGGTLNNCTLIGNSVHGYIYFGLSIYFAAGLGGGAANCSLSNCVLIGNSAYAAAGDHTDAPGEGGGASNCSLNNCVLIANYADDAGGGAALVYDYSGDFNSGGMLNNCTLTGNSANLGGGAFQCMMTNCTLNSNSAGQSGGGADSCTLSNCKLIGNLTSATIQGSNVGGGGAAACVLNDCMLISNSASGTFDTIAGGGADGCMLNNCLLAGNSINEYGTDLFLGAAFGGGASGSTLNNCTLINNSAINWQYVAELGIWYQGPISYGGGVYGGALNNCVISFNIAANGPNYYDTGVLNSCCTTPMPTNGFGNITNAPLFVDLASGNLRLQSNSPCIHAGNNAYAPAGPDLDGNPRIVGGTVDIGAYEFQGTLGTTHYVDLNSTNPTPPYTNWATAARLIQDAVDAATSGDEVVVTNGIYATGGRSLDGMTTNRVAMDKPITLRSANGPEATTVDGSAWGGHSTRCVYLCNGASLSGFTLINGEVFFGPGGGVMCETPQSVVSNCVISGNGNWDGPGGGVAGGTLIHCTLRENWAQSGSYSDSRGGGAFSSNLNDCTLSSNGADIGGGACQCILNNCTLINNAVGSSMSGAGKGGGAAYSTLNDCALTANSAYGAPHSDFGLDGGDGGGAFDCTLNNCALLGNLAEGSGGGSAGGFLNNCTLMGNTARSLSGSGGGAAAGTLRNCIVHSNTFNGVANNYGADTFLSYCCTTPMPTNGFGNITNAPMLVDLAGGNLRLQSNSPCIDSGNNSYVAAGPDLAGNPRIAGGTVDIGAYEFQNHASTISYAWLQQYGLPTDGSSDSTDPDADGMSNWQEWRCRTDPTNAISALRMVSALPTSTNALVTWQSAAGVNYFLERGAGLGSPNPFSLVRSNLLGQTGTTTYTDTNAVGAGPFFYRIGVGN